MSVSHQKLPFLTQPELESKMRQCLCEKAGLKGIMLTLNCPCFWCFETLGLHRHIGWC